MDSPRPRQTPSANHPAHPLPMTDAEAAAEAKRIITNAYQPTAFHDTTPLPAYGATPPVAQPGRPPMSQRATDASALMLSGSIASLSVGGATSLVLYTLGQVDPVTLTVGAAGPVALILAAGSLLRSAGRARADAHTEHHHHYQGPVHQDQHTVHATTRGIWAKTTNQQ
ncbi:MULTISPECIES: hypothetical protein [unclassified Streptomyces]|uniref:hypothetical protein n=1 Tax=unclassified Streptomyces TaxID=2593676 RepID=UPI001F544E49|nr:MULTISPECIES: hypothetical protein [unclassified Streptomyces]